MGTARVSCSIRARQEDKKVIECRAVMRHKANAGKCLLVCTTRQKSVAHSDAVFIFIAKK